MQINQNSNNSTLYFRSSRKQRIIAGVIFISIACLFGLLWLASREIINIGLLLGPCGFKQRFSLPCPTCGITTSAIAFAGGQILRAFYIQPAGAFFCIVLVIAAVLSFITAIFGIYFRWLQRFFAEVKLRYIILAIIIIIAAGWAVTLSRALVQQQ